jgi:hypothetical protein
MVAAIQPSLSHHAIIRVMQRMFGIELAVDEYQFGTKFCMLLHLYAGGMTRAQVERTILTDGVVAAIRAGASSITIDGGTLVVKNGNVVTIHFFAKHRSPRKLKVPTRRDSHRRAQRRDRRLRGVPL